jgi:hypothetical protein
MFTQATLSIALALTVLGCKSGTYQSTSADGSTVMDVVTVGETYYTQTNLLADPGRDEIYTTNYQLALLIPLGTEIRVDSVQRKAMHFTVVATGATYEYTIDKHLQAAFPDNIAKVFGKENPSAKPAGLSETDQEGIRAGMPMVGMSREGVILACGYPPDHATPSLEMTQWTYWRNRWVKRVVNFDAEGKVSSIQG